jgi:hypothetical protein
MSSHKKDSNVVVSICEKISDSSENYFTSLDRDELEADTRALAASSTKVSGDHVKLIYITAINSYPLLSQLLREHLKELPPTLRFALVSRVLYSDGTVEHPESISDELEEILQSDDTDLYSVEAIGHRIFNLREAVLANPDIDLIVLQDEFENSGDIGNLSAIIRNPNCPIDLIELLKAREHFIFSEDVQEKESLDELVLQAEEVLASR